MPLDTTAKSKIIADHARGEVDTGSPEVQIALLTQRITEINAHLKEQPKDHAATRGLLRLVGRRTRLLNYLRREDIDRYRELTQKLGLRVRKGGTA